jgi:hypothetical protein
MKTFFILLISIISFKTNAKTTFDPEKCTTEKIIKDIKKLRNFEHNKVYNFFAKHIYEKSKKYNIHCEIPTLLLRVESSFTIKNNPLSGEISIAQINYDFWYPIFKNKFNTNLNKKKLISSNSYAIKNMFIILNYLRNTYRKKDPLWFLRYNSNYILHRLTYLTKFEKFLYKIHSDKKILNYDHKENLLRYAVKKYGWKETIKIYTLLETKEEKQKNYEANVIRWRKEREKKYQKQSLK